MAHTLNNVATVLKSQGKYEEALPLHGRALSIGKKALGPEHPHVATTLNNMALLLKSQGKYEEALPLYQRAVRIMEKALGPEHIYVADHAAQQRRPAEESGQVRARPVDFRETAKAPGHGGRG